MAAKNSKRPGKKLERLLRKLREATDAEGIVSQILQRRLERLIENYKQVDLSLREVKKNYKTDRKQTQTIKSDHDKVLTSFGFGIKKPKINLPELR